MKIYFAPTTHIETYGDPVKFYKVISNIVSNAIDAYEECDEKETEKNKEREILIRVSQKNNNACIEIQDWGAGITPEHLKRIFEPFFTTKSIEKGTGLGLSICKSIIEGDFDGHIYVKSKPGQGTIFTIEFLIRKNNG